MKLDRRSFLRGGFALVGGAAISTGLISCAPKKTAVDDAAGEKSLSVDENWYGAPSDLSNFDIADTWETDLLICGFGAGGKVATAIAFENGLKAITIEKGSDTGSGVKTEFGCIGSSIDARYGVSVDPQKCLDELTRYANGWCNPRVASVWANESGTTFDWLSGLLSKKGAIPFFLPDVGDGWHGIWPVYPLSHSIYCPPTQEELDAAAIAVQETGNPAAQTTILPDLNKLLVEQIEEWGADVRYSTSLVQLTQDLSGKVTGVIAKGDNGYIKIKVTKGVILATGGYEASHELLSTLNPEAESICGYPQYFPSNVGDGIKAGIWAGGVKDEIPTLMTFGRAAISPDQKLGYPYVGTTNWMGDQPFPKVNLEGNRVCCESAPYDYPLHIAHQLKDCKLASIWDANYKDHIKQFHTLGCSRIGRVTVTGADGTQIDNASTAGMTIEAFDGMMAASEANGAVQTADTIEELAEKMGINAEGLKKTIENYNKMAAAGVDTEFGKPAKDLIALNTPPYSGSFFGGHILCTLDGLKIDENMRVLDKDKNPIEGLFAVGNCSGSIYAGSYPELLIGNACARTCTEARHTVLYIKDNA